MPEPVLSAVNRPCQFSYENGVVITKLVPELCEGELRAGPCSINPHGTIHGGALATLADTVSGCCACSRGGSCVTATSSMEYLRPASGPTIFCRATPKRMGHTLSVIQFTMTDENGEVVCTGTYTFYMLPAPLQKEVQSPAENRSGQN